MKTCFSLEAVSPVRFTAAALSAAAVWLLVPELALAAVTFGDIGQNVADSAKGVAKGVTMAGFASGAGMLPLRSASPWKEGSLLLRTQDGKLFPFAPNSSEQAAWIDLGVAPMGGGKSVFLNAMNFAFVTQAGLSRLPWVSIIDVGPSSSGLITLIQENLPEGKKHLAAYHRLRMTEDFAINPFDTPLGCRQPLPSHMAFLVNLLTLLCTPLENTPPDKDVPGLVRRAIELAYEELSDKHQPRLYQSNVLPELHELLMCENIVLNAMPSWWEVVDALFERGFVHAATVQCFQHSGVGNHFGSVYLGAGYGCGRHGPRGNALWQTLQFTVDAAAFCGGNGGTGSYLQRAEFLSGSYSGLHRLFHQLGQFRLGVGHRLLCRARRADHYTGS